MMAGIPVRGPKQSKLSRESTKLQTAPAEVWATLNGGGVVAAVAAVIAGIRREPLQRGHWIVAPASFKLASRNCWQCGQLNLMDVMQALQLAKRLASNARIYIKMQRSGFETTIRKL